METDSDVSIGFSTLMCLPINILGLIFRINNLLAAIQPIIPGQHITQCNRNQKIRHPLESKQLKTDQQRSDGAVGNSTEYRTHANGGTQRNGTSGNGCKKGSKCCSDKKSWNDLTAFVSGTERGSSKNHF